MELTKEALDRIRALAQKATPGPWEYNEAFVLVRLPDETELKDMAKPRLDTNIINVNRAFGPDVCKANAAYIAAANPQVILALISEIENLQSLNDKLVEGIAGPFFDQINKIPKHIQEKYIELKTSLTWTKTRPCGPGFYFYKRRSMQVVKIEWRGRDDEPWLHCVSIGQPVEFLDGQWAGPIPEPVET